MRYLYAPTTGERVNPAAAIDDGSVVRYVHAPVFSKCALPVRTSVRARPANPYSPYPATYEIRQGVAIYTEDQFDGAFSKLLACTTLSLNETADLWNRAIHHLDSWVAVPLPS